MIEPLRKVKITVINYDEFDNEVNEYTTDMQDMFRLLQIEYRRDKEELHEKLYQLIFLEETIEVVDRDLNTSTYKVIQEKKSTKNKGVRK